MPRRTRPGLCSSILARGCMNIWENRLPYLRDTPSWPHSWSAGDRDTSRRVLHPSSRPDGRGYRPDSPASRSNPADRFRYGIDSRTGDTVRRRDRRECLEEDRMPSGFSDDMPGWNPVSHRNATEYSPGNTPMLPRSIVILDRSVYTNAYTQPVPNIRVLERRFPTTEQSSDTRLYSMTLQIMAPLKS